MDFETILRELQTFKYCVVYLMEETQNINNSKNKIKKHTITWEVDTVEVRKASGGPGKWGSKTDQDAACL